MRFNRFVFLNRPLLSLETHLGVTTSPQAPFPTDYVTWSVSDQSPPLRLTPSRSRRRSCSVTSTSASQNMHSRHAPATCQWRHTSGQLGSLHWEPLKGPVGESQSIEHLYHALTMEFLPRK